MSRPSFSFTPLDDQFTLKLSCKYTFRLIKRARVLTNTLSSRESICFELNEFPRLIGLQFTSFLPDNSYFRKYFRKDYLNEYISVSSKNDRFGHIFRSVLELELINRSNLQNIMMQGNETLPQCFTTISGLHGRKSPTNVRF